MSQIVLKSNKREAVGKNQVNKLRQEKLIPGVVYVHEGENKNVQFEARDFEMIVHEVGTSRIFDLNVDGEVIQVLVKDVQAHPYKNQTLHVDFQEIVAGQTLRVQIPIVLTGRDNIRLVPSVLLQELEEITIECEPKDLPQFAEIDVENMEYNDVFYVKDLDVFMNDALVILTHEDDVVCSLVEPQTQEEAVDEDAEDLENTDAGEASSEDGE